MTIYYGDELYHYGIPGQKWGLRRYQNEDGSYTQAGLERYRKSSDNYEKKKSAYKAIKKDRTVSKYNKQKAKAEMKYAKAKMDKDYKHLKQDKLADKGKLRYMSGQRIRGNSAVTNFLRTAGSLAATAAIYGSQTGMIGKKTAEQLLIGGIATAGIGQLKSYTDEIPNRQLRAYYSHTSNY